MIGKKRWRTCTLVCLLEDLGGNGRVTVAQVQYAANLCLNICSATVDSALPSGCSWLHELITQLFTIDEASSPGRLV